MLKFLKGTRRVPVWVLLASALWIIVMLVAFYPFCKYSHDAGYDEARGQIFYNKADADSLLEQAISTELHTQDTYAVEIREWGEIDGLFEGDYIITHFEITGMTKKAMIDWSQFD